MRLIQNQIFYLLLYLLVPAFGISQESSKSQFERNYVLENNQDISTNNNYQIGIGDVLLISFQSRASYSQKHHNDFELEVDNSGNIFFDLIGLISASGLTVSELRNVLLDTLSSLIRKPWVTIKVKEYNSQKVTVFGEARNGIYSLKEPTRIAYFISSIGGPMEKADLSGIKVVRADGSVVSIDLTKFLYGHDSNQNIYLKGGDLVIIPDLDQKKVLVLGEVKSPGPVFIKNQLTVIEALVEAGGGTSQANLKAVKVIHFGEDKPKMFSINLDKAYKKMNTKDNITLRSGDIVFVPGKGDAIKSLNKLLGTIIPTLQTILLIKAIN